MNAIVPLAQSRSLNDRVLPLPDSPTMRMLATGFRRSRFGGNGGKDIGAFGGPWSEGVGWATGAGGVEEGVAGAGAPLARGGVEGEATDGMGFETVGFFPRIMLV